MISAAKSITHQHLLSVLNTETEGFSELRRLRILDIGCGDGHLINYLMENIAVLNPNLNFEIFGFDVDDHGVQSEGYFVKTIEVLEERFPDIAWEDRLCVFSARDTWPYPDDFFDIVISNQVVEHVDDHNLFFSEIKRTLCPDGFSVHLFPLRHNIYESHLHLPLVHMISNHDFMVSYIKVLSKIGLGKYKNHNKSKATPLNEYAKSHADFIFFFTNYLSYSEVLKLGKRHSLPGSFRYTQEFYWAKLRSIFGFKPIYKFKKNRSAVADWFAIFLLKYVAAVTLVLNNSEDYTKK
ncbi:class I SAM-dependent methyltransferase [Sneathiella litorea]|uniref:Methyltransferase domain-containing protein n=1 Tax=Sneathiella litorea TaxID=2606216 RepID=A0A6L8WDE3_9PROT|nr:class I SAM-dependent methyltransferase [Sneathiella litorea]MZR32392.1 methyltransferase domain-containing protein [Sneathiella litorea]